MKAFRNRLLGRAIINLQTGCWEWSGSKDRDGYARINGPGQRSGLAHRYAYELIEGPIPAGLELDHTCRVRHCINPAHLEPVTHVENMQRMLRPDRSRGDFCRHGHEWNDANTYKQNGVVKYCRACQRAAQARAKQRRIAKKGG